jgi:hypothetical protein
VWSASVAPVLAYIDVDLSTDAQCGSEAIRADVAHRLLPLVEDTGWFFDTELLVLADRGPERRPTSRRPTSPAGTVDDLGAPRP